MQDVAGSERPTTTFVGRERELEELQTALESAGAGRGSLHLITGDPGIGKTRLAEELADRAERSGWLAVWGRCWEGGGAPEFWPWLQVLRSLSRRLGARTVADGLGEEAATFALLDPEIGSAGAGRTRVDIDGDTARFLQFAAVARLLRTIAQVRQLIVVIDDLHAADRSSMLLMRYLATDLRDGSVLLVGTHRQVEAAGDGEAADALRWLGREGRTLELRGLDRLEVEWLVADVLPVDETERLADEVYRTTEGNPLFVDEMLRAVAAGDRARLPARVRDAIRRRLAELGDETRSVLSVAATIGRDFDEALASSAGAIDGQATAAALRTAEALGIVRAETASRWSFSHGLFREVLVADLPDEVRARMHAAAADALERRHARDAAPPVAELAHHYAAAVDVVGPERAITYSLRAGERATRSLAYEEAVAHFGRALALLDTGDTDREFGLLLRLGDARARAGDLAAGRDAIERAIELARETRDPVRLGEGALALGSLNLGEAWTRPWLADRTLVAVLEEAIAGLDPATSPLATRIAALLAAALHFSDRREEGAALSDTALAAARRLDDPVSLLYCLGARHLAAWSPDNLDERLALATELVEVAEENGSTELVLQGRVWRMTDLLEAGRIAEADEELEAYVRAAEASRRPQLHGYVAFLRAQRAIFDGRLDEADRLADEAYRLAEQVGDENVLGSYWCLVLPMRRWQGRLKEIEPGYRDAYRRYAPNVGWRLALCWISSQVGSEEETRRLLEGVLADGSVQVPRDAYYLGMLPFLAEACARLDDREGAAAVLDAYGRFADRHPTAGRDGVCLWGSAARPLGVLAATAGQPEEALALLEEGIEANRRMGTGPWLAESQVEYATVLLSRGDPGDLERARGALDEASAAARRFEMPGLLARIEALAADAPASTDANVFRREGEYWTLVYGGTSVRVRDAKGLHDLVELVRANGREVHVADLMAASYAPPAEPQSGALEPDLETGGHIGEPLLDATARAAYRRRLVELQEDLAEAERHHDVERAARAREEMDLIAAELAAAFGLGGRVRRAADPTERARKAVAQRIRNAIGRIGRLHPELGAHLERSIRTGRFCSYAPERPTTWAT